MKQVIYVLKSFLEILGISEKKKLGISLILIVISGLLELVGIFSFLPFFSLISNSNIIDENIYLKMIFEFTHEYADFSVNHFILLTGLLCLFFVFISMIFRCFSSFFTSKFVGMQNYYLSERILAGYMLQSYEDHTFQNSGNFSSKTLELTTSFVNRVVKASMMLTSSFFIIIFISLTLFYLNPLVTISIFLLFSLYYSLVFRILSKKINDAGVTHVKESKNRYMILSHILGGYKEFRITNSLVYSNIFKKSSLSFSKTSVNLNNYNQIPNIILEYLLYGTALLITLLTFYFQQGANDNMLSLLPQFVIFGISGVRLRPAFSQFFTACTDLKSSVDLVDQLKPHISDYRTCSFGAESLNFSNTITFDSVSFKYRESLQNNLHNINIRVEIGESVGIVGATGAGKSTLLDMLLGLIYPTSGFLKIDSTPITLDNVLSWQKNIGYVAQTPYLLDATVSENIAFGLSTSDINFARVINSSKTAMLHEFVISKLPHGYDTIIGERGARLSGGQCQRIALARALYNNPKVLIFDEATSALDFRTESKIYSSLRTLSPKITQISVVHRVHALQNHDKIVVLHEGQVVNIGDYETLSKNCNHFRSLL